MESSPKPFLRTNKDEIEERYYAILDYSSDQIFMIDTNFRYISVSKSLAESLGKKVEEIINKTIKEVYGDSDQTIRFSNNIRSVFSSEEKMNIDEELVIGSNKSFINTQLAPVKNSSGEVTAVLGIARDVTEQKLVEEELKKSRVISESKIKELEKFNQLMIDRELKMIELKGAIKNLEKKLKKYFFNKINRLFD